MDLSFGSFNVGNPWPLDVNAFAFKPKESANISGAIDKSLLNLSRNSSKPNCSAAKSNLDWASFMFVKFLWSL